MPSLFASIVGQDDNLGDSVLRRGYLETLRSLNPAAVHLWVGTHSDSYLSGLGLDGSEVLHRSRSVWFRALARAAVAKNCTVALRTGEVQFTTPVGRLGWKSVAEYQLLKRSGARLVAAGLGIRDVSVPISGATRTALKACSVVAWRDEASQSVAGVGSVFPDWAFREASVVSPGGCETSGETRRFLTVCLRGDRPGMADSEVQALKELARIHGLEIYVVTQVERDADRAIQLSELLNSDSVAVWRNESHEAWERRVRQIYSASTFVYSDRLHAHILSMTEGAVPIPANVAGDDKSVRTLLATGYESVSLNSWIDGSILAPLRVEDEAARVRDCVGWARSALSEFEIRLSRTLNA